MEKTAILNRFITSARRIEKAENYISAQRRGIDSDPRSGSASIRDNNLLNFFEEMRFVCIDDLDRLGSKLR